MASFNETFKSQSTAHDLLFPETEKLRREEELTIPQDITFCQFGSAANHGLHFPVKEVEIVERRRQAGKLLYVVKPVDGTPVVGLAFVPNKELRRIVKASTPLYTGRFYEYTTDPSAPSHVLREEQALQKLKQAV